MQEASSTIGQPDNRRGPEPGRRLQSRPSKERSPSPRSLRRDWHYHILYI